MNLLIDLINRFEKRNNFSITIQIHGDASGLVVEFWDEKPLYHFDSTDDLEGYLQSEQYEFDNKGRAIERPCKRATDEKGG